MNVACLLGHIGRDDYLGVLVDDCLGVVGVVETVNGFHHPGFGIGEVALAPAPQVRRWLLLWLPLERPQSCRRLSLWPCRLPSLLLSVCFVLDRLFGAC